MMFAKGTNQMKNTVNVVLHLKIEQRYVNYKKRWLYIYSAIHTIMPSDKVYYWFNPISYWVQYKIDTCLLKGTICAIALLYTICRVTLL